jgi:hypothetical protein
LAEARGAGAQRDAEAAKYLSSAQEEYAGALKLVRDGHAQGADYLLLAAEADARLATALARRAVAKAEADRELDQLREVTQAPAPQGEPGEPHE